MDEKPDADPILQFFAHTHLPSHLAAVSAPFGELAKKMHDMLQSNHEREAMLRSLLVA